MKFVTRITFFLWLGVLPNFIISCKSSETDSDSALRDIGIVNTQDASTKVIYSEQNKVYLKVCKPPVAPPLTRNCPSEVTAESLDLPIYIAKLPYDVGPYQRDAQALSLVTKALNDAQNAAQNGNQNAAVAAQKLTTIKANLEKILKISKDLDESQQDVTVYEYEDDFQKLLIPFADSNESSSSSMRFVAVQGRNFYMSQTETTRGQWKSVMGNYPEELPGWNNCAGRESYVSEDSHPVSCVSWLEANDFARRMNDKNDGYNYRLPTEEEWVHAAGVVQGLSHGWCDASRTQAVGRLKESNGLYDAAGNVAEWTSTVKDIGVGTRMVMGSGWSHYVHHCNSTVRVDIRPSSRSAAIGFRVLRTAGSSAR